MVRPRASWLVLTLVPIALAACNALLGNDSWTSEDGNMIPEGSDASDDGETAAPAPDGSLPFDQRTPDTSSTDSAGPAPDADSGGGTGLDKCLVLPSADAAPCSPVGNEVVCSLGECLITGPGNEGRCQECQAQGTCSGHANALCNVAEDCDIGWACYCNACTLMCPLNNTPFCGSSQCINVGNATEGICFPPN